MYKLLDGNALSKQLKDELAEKVSERVENGKKQPHLAAILVGLDGASQTYVNSKIQSCEKVGFKSTLLHFDENTSEEKVLEAVNTLNNDDDIDGFIVQLPLPKHINTNKVIHTIAPHKDVDGFHPMNMGNLALGLDTFVSATPLGIMKMLERYQIDTKGKHCVVLGRSNIVGRPMSILMSANTNPGNCTVTLCHSHTQNIKEITLTADIIIVALGIPEYLKADMVKQNAVVIDVGITRVEDNSKASGYSLKGDVKFDEVAPKTSYITPVPGGVGPMTVTSLMLNTLKATQRKD